ncbi:thiamine pyrophosphate-dependent enzyme, partial [Pseudomonas kurunegalensis]
NYKAHKPNTVLLDNALATMGAGLPSAMAAHLVHPDRPVISVCGDGGFMMNSQELETAVRLGMHITVVILR